MINKLTEMSRGMCKLYRDHVRKFGDDVQIDFAKGDVVEDKSGNFPAGTYCYYEEFIPEYYSIWTKWCNNYNYFDENLLQIHPHINAVIHFMYAKTKGAFTILDIQGKYLKQDNGSFLYKLSDPAFTST